MIYKRGLAAMTTLLPVSSRKRRERENDIDLDRLDEYTVARDPALASSTFFQHQMATRDPFAQGVKSLGQLFANDEMRLGNSPIVHMSYYKRVTDNHQIIFLRVRDGTWFRFNAIHVGGEFVYNVGVFNGSDWTLAGRAHMIPDGPARITVELVEVDERFQNKGVCAFLLTASVRHMMMFYRRLNTIEPLFLQIRVETHTPYSLLRCVDKSFRRNGYRWRCRENLWLAAQQIEVAYRKRRQNNLSVTDIPRFQESIVYQNGH
jgi:hypothetical protein